MKSAINVYAILQSVSFDAIEEQFLTRDIKLERSGNSSWLSNDKIVFTKSLPKEDQLDSRLYVIVERPVICRYIPGIRILDLKDNLLGINPVLGDIHWNSIFNRLKRKVSSFKTFIPASHKLKRLLNPTPHGIPAIDIVPMINNVPDERIVEVIYRRLYGDIDNKRDFLKALGTRSRPAQKLYDCLE